jgi:hypothetical protein
MVDIEEQEQEFTLVLLDGWFICSHHTASDKVALQRWLEETDGGRYWYGFKRLYFEREEDMILFTLTWS